MTVAISSKTKLLLWVITPKFNRERIARRGIAQDTPFIIKLCAEYPVLDLPSLEEKYGSIDIWQLLVPTTPESLKVINVTGSVLSIVSKIHPDHCRRYSTYERNVNVTVVEKRRCVSLKDLMSSRKH